tara:strand:- start:333 stop:524 length:192 start_codon:yes stop_codon:yes gene_type:complete
MKITQQIDGGGLDKSACGGRYDSTDLNVHLTFFGGDTLSFHASREALAELVYKLNFELEKVES